MSFDKMNPDQLEMFFAGLDKRDSVGDAIVRQEQRGQRSLGNSDRLPRRVTLKGDWDLLEKLGIVRGPDLDDLFCAVTLPAGWSISPTDHDLWSKLLDDQGRERASIFYKAAHYDRDAFLSLRRAVTVYIGPVNGWESETYRTDPRIVRVLLAGKVVWESEVKDMINQFDGNDPCIIAGKAWMAENYPNADDPLAYWD